MSNIIFNPWIGKNYKTGGILGKKILALGESHYFGESEEVVELTKQTDFTSEVIEEYLNTNGEFEGWKNTYKKFERALTGKETTNADSRNIWDSIAFYNYLQAALSYPRQPVPEKLYEKSEGAFFEALEMLRPDLIVCWGTSRLYDMMSAKNWTPLNDKKIGDKNIKNGLYELNDGTKIKAIWIYHPSTAFDWSYWHDVIQAFLASN